MRLRCTVQESDLTHGTPKAQLFQALKQRKLSGESFHSLLSKGGSHRGLTSGEANQPLEDVDGKSSQNVLQVSMPVLPPNASPEENGRIKQVNISSQSQQVPKALLFDQLKRVPSALSPVVFTDQLYDSKSFDISGITPVGKDFCSSSEDIQNMSSFEVVESMPASVERMSNINQSGLSNKSQLSFVDGFPPNWKDLLSTPETKTSLRTPSIHSDVQRVLEEAKPLSGAAEENRGSCRPNKMSNVAKNLSNKGSKQDPLTLQDLPVTRRSGRLVFPPLAWWANQRVMVDPTSNATVIAQENENALDLPAVHFKSRNEIPSVNIGKERVKNKETLFEMKDQKVTKDEKESPQMPQQTLPQKKGSKRLLMVNRKRSLKSDSTEEISGSFGGSCNIENDIDVIKVPVRHGTKLKGTVTVQESKVTQKSEKQTKKNSLHHCHDKLNKNDNEKLDYELEGKKRTRSCSVVLSSPKRILRNDNTGENVRQKKPRQRGSPEVHSCSPRHKDICSKLPSVPKKSRLNCASEERFSATEDSSLKRIKKQSLKKLVSDTSVELVYTKSDHSQRMIVMRQDSKKRRERVEEEQFSFLTKTPLPMEDLPPKSRPSQFHASGNLSDLCDSDDSSNVEYFFSSDES